MLHEQFVAKWERTRRKGRHHFTWVYGVLGWGASFGLFSKNPERWSIPFCMLPLELLGGYIWGAAMWRWGEWKYEETVLLLEAAGRREAKASPEREPSSEAIQRLDQFRRG